jgi:hypothetical protein
MSAKIERVGRHYLTLQGCGTKEESLQVIKRMTQYLEIVFEKELISTYFVRSLYNEDIILDQALEAEEILLFTNGRLPLVFCNISFDIAKREASQASLNAFEAEFEMKLFRSFSIRR